MVSRYQKVVVRKDIVRPYGDFVLLPDGNYGYNKKPYVAIKKGEVAIREIRGCSSTTVTEKYTIQEAIQDIQECFDSEYSHYKVQMTPEQIVQKLLDDDNLILKLFWKDKKDNAFFVKKVDGKEVVISKV